MSPNYAFLQVLHLIVPSVPIKKVLYHRYIGRINAFFLGEGEGRGNVRGSGEGIHIVGCHSI